MTAEEKAWINAYEDGDVVYFKSNNCEEDTLTVKRSNISDRWNPIYIHFIDNDRGPYYSATACYYFYINGNGYKYDGKFGIIKDSESNKIEVYSDLNSKYSNLDLIPFNKYYQIAKNKIHPDVCEFTIDSVTYKDCLVFDNSNSSYPNNKYYPKEEDTIERFVINKDFGLIYYEKYDGEVFKRDWVKSPAKRHL